MYSAVLGVYFVLLVLESIALVVAWAQSRSLRSLIGMLLALGALGLLLTPESSLIGFVGRTFTGSFGLYLASLLYPSSKIGLVVYGVLTILPLLVGWTGGPWQRRASRPPKKRQHR